MNLLQELNMYSFGKLLNKRTLRLPVIGLVALTACGGDSKQTPESSLTSPNGSSTGLPNDSTRNQPAGALAGIRIMPQTITVLMNSSVSATVHSVDARGIPTLAQLAGRPAWSVRNATVASVSVDGVIRSNAVGTTKLYAVWNNYKDSATVNVVASRDTVPSGGGSGGGGTGGRPDTTSNGGGGKPGRPDSTYTPPAPVATFNLSAYIFGRATPASPRDTANVVQMGGASVSLYRLAPMTSSHSDSMSVRTLVQTVIANSNGKAVFANVPSGYYSVVATATYQGNALEGRSDFAPPREREYAVAVYLNKK